MKLFDYWVIYICPECGIELRSRAVDEMEHDCVSCKAKMIRQGREQLKNGC